MFGIGKTTKTSSSYVTRKYGSCTNVQLASVIKSMQRQYATLAKNPTSRSFTGKTAVQQCRAIQQQVKVVAKLLRDNTVAQIDARIKTLRTQAANTWGVKVSSTKTSTPAVKRLIAKRRQVMACPTITRLVTVCKSFSPYNYNNPKVSSYSSTYVSGKKKTTRKTKGRGYSTTTAKKKTTRKTKGRGYSTTTYGYTTTKTSTFKKPTAVLKREISKLKQRNSFMKKQVAKFRKEVAQLQRHYGTLNNKPRWRVVQSSKQVGKEVSNIVRFSNALSNAFLKQPQRKAG